MQVNITARHLKLTPAISDYVQKKLEKAKRFLDGVISAQVVLEVSKTRHMVEIILRASGTTITAKKESTDLYAAIDLATDKLDEQLKRFKERRTEHRPKHRGRSRADVWPEPVEGSDVDFSAIHVSSTKVLTLSPMSLTEAIGSMEQSDSAHWIFLNRVNRRVTVLYRKPDKTYGVVESIT